MDIAGDWAKDVENADNSGYDSGSNSKESCSEKEPDSVEEREHITDEASRELQPDVSSSTSKDDGYELSRVHKEMLETDNVSSSDDVRKHNNIKQNRYRSSRSDLLQTYKSPRFNSPFLSALDARCRVYVNPGSRNITVMGMPIHVAELDTCFGNNCNNAAPDAYYHTELPRIDCVQEGFISANSIRFEPCMFILRGSFTYWIKHGYLCVQSAAAKFGLTNVTISHTQNINQRKLQNGSGTIHFAIRASGTGWALQFLQHLELLLMHSDPHPVNPGQFKMTFPGISMK
ncbi:hypothetical protein DP163_gp132 [Sea otter poxvirus]|uniref:Uncharacterized protein n=1 Tax=Sea otter poxvirus TaxID=1416741 RepID=A0A2U9QHI0_9POXV|nr:hypothetical protein DP163_gp001 [Sea otter poxvirus]YP_009480670.1 hypothetical protein DP163_gp132 [Sea otter poxvirus]AWU47046.1 hypothetical protein [Sea otter poxvirus]AWU47177.1 hypothetical protein [Sea otter poxvirus]